ncbi:hypothetical protein ACHQM5_025518 [Ranunculus cassubicifolius]
MAIQEILVKFKFHFILLSLLSIVFLSLFLVAPRFLTILSYFWPLFLSTALFLFAVVFFGKISPLASETCNDIAGEGLLDYVAGQPQEPIQDGEEKEEAVEK